MPSVPHPGAALIFLRELRSSGSPVLRLHGYGPSPEGLLLLEEDAGNDLLLIPLLKSWHLEAVEDIGGPPLPFDESAARHGAILLLRAAWFYLHRDSDAAAVTRAFSEPPPGPPSPAALFSADLTLQHLPSLFRMAQALAAELRWSERYLWPWLWRHARGLSSGDGCCPKRPHLAPVAVPDALR